MKLSRLLVTVVCLCDAVAVSAQTIQPADYLPLGDGFQWAFERTAGSGRSKIQLEVTDVNVADTGTRYLIEVPVEEATLGMRLEVATDGSLLLRSIKADLTELLDDLPADPSATADVQFTPPVLLGAPSLVPGAAVVETPIDIVFDADLETNVGDVDLDVRVTGTITARWDPATSPTVTPAGTFTDVVTFALHLSLTFSEDTFDTEGSVNERISAVLARDVGFVQLETDDGTYALVRAVVNGVPIGDFPQYEEIVGLGFTVPPLIALDGRALGEASSGDIALRDIRLSQRLDGKGQLDAILDHPAAAGVPISIDGPTKAKPDGTLHVKLEGSSVIGDQKMKLRVKQLLDSTSTTLELTVKIGEASTVIPVGIVPVVSGDVRISLDGLVDQSAEPGSKRTLVSDGRLLLGEVEHPIVAKEKLQVKKDGTRKRTYKFKPVGDDTVVVQVDATSTSAADFTITKVKPTLFKREVKPSAVAGVTADVVAP